MRLILPSLTALLRPFSSDLTKAVLMKNVWLSGFFLCVLAVLPGACGPSEPVGSQVYAAEACDVAKRAVQRERRPVVERAAIGKAESSRGTGSPALWSFSDEDTTVYLFGTVHLLRPGVDWKSEPVARAVSEAGLVVFEADTSSAEAQRQLISFYTEHGVFGDGTRLSQMLTEKEKADLADAVDQIGWPMGAIEPMQPWRAAIDLSVKVMLDGGFDPRAGVEHVIEQEAQANGARFQFLETVDEQLGGLATLPVCDQLDFLMVTIDSLDATSTSLDRLVGEWLDGDVSGISALMANPEALGSEEVFRVMLTERNRRWVPKILSLLEEPGTVLVAVGAGHLAGEVSVIRMLRDLGYDVRGP